MASSYQTPRARSSGQLGSRRAAPPSNAKAHPPLPSAPPFSHNSGFGSSRSLPPAHPPLPSPSAGAAAAKFSTPSRGLKVRISSASSLSSDSPRAPLSARSDVSCARSDISCASRSAFDVKRAENIVVTVRFRPLSGREIQQGDEVAWYADGDVIVRSEFNPSTAYAYDRVFGPATTTRSVYDIAAQHVISGAMEGINGTVFAYGVTSSGKTHTIHGVQKSPGIIPLAVKDVFNIIQDMPGREFLLRVSYLEIYNEVINDLLNPMGQNLRIREDSQGTYVEGIKQEVVLSPAHALSLIAAGEEHRHVGSNNFNLISSRSHTIFTLTIESSPQGDSYKNKEVTLSQLNLIDLAGSESSKAETTGLRRKEGSYINKSLLTLGTVISKLTDARASHIPYRDSKLTRLLQSSLSGNGRVSVICTVTPASSCNEETHNTLKFAQRAKHIEVHVSPNIIMDEKSLIKKYQKEIMKLKEELQQLKKGMIQRPSFSTTQEDLRTLRQQMEAGQVQLQSRLEEEEQAKEALMVRIQRLTKLILVSTKNTIPYNSSERSSHRRRYSFGEEELAYLPEKKCGYDEEEIATGSTEAKVEPFTHDDGSKEEKKTKKHGMLSWLKLRRPERLQISSLNSVDHDSSPNGSLADRSNNSIESNSEHKATNHKLKKGSDDVMPINEPLSEATQAGELFSASNRSRRLPPTGTTIVDQMDLLKEQIKMLSGEVALCTSALKRMIEQASNKPDDIELKAQINKLKEEMREKQHQIQVLEQRIMDTKEIMTPRHSPIELSQMMAKLKNQLSERSFEVELKTADNRILQEQLQSKTAEIKDLQETVSSLQSQLQAAIESKYFGNKKTSSFADSHRKANSTNELQEEFSDWLNTADLSRELHFVEGGVVSKGFDSQVFSTRKKEPYGNPHFFAQAATIEKLKHEKVRLEEEREGLKVNIRKLSDEASYAKELATAAAEELKNLAEEVTKLSSQNSKLRNDLAAAQNLALWQTSSISLKDVSASSSKHEHADVDSVLTNQSEISLLEKNAFSDDQVMPGTSKLEMETRIQDLCQELQTRKESEVVLESLLTEKDHLLADLQKHVAESKRREIELESDLAGMWVLVAKLKRETGLDPTTMKPREPLERNTESKLGKGSNFDNNAYGSLRVSPKNGSQLDDMEEMDVLLDDMKHAPYDTNDMKEHLHVTVGQSTGRSLQ